PEYFKINLSSKAIKILIDELPFYEIAFFSQTLIDEMKRLENLNNDYKYKIHSSPKSFIHDPIEIPKWVIGQISIITNEISYLKKLMGNAFPAFFKDPG